MRYLKTLGSTAVTAAALMTMSSPASATFLEIKGVPQEGPIAITASLESGTSTAFQKTDGTFANTCTSSNIQATITGFAVLASGPVSSLTFSSCTNEKVVVDEKGSLSLQYIGTSTNGTMRSTGTKVTVPSPFGLLTCVTSEGTDIGTLTGVKEGRATMDISGVLNCGLLASSMIWRASYVVTSPEGLGVTMEFP